ncbi:head-tail connector protein [Defluviimonas sp. SAOS-178_SWC]|uniref:head-tail connector protein n=1 Tax=Defluviimonas sp. SAOS-178_SWC TaxID=3121287 RepID=UPI003221E9A8
MHNMTLVTPPTALPVDVKTVKDNLRIGFPDDDYLIDQLLKAAIGRFDGWSGILGRALMPQSWTLTLDAFPTGCIAIPLGPVVSVTSIKYWDTTPTQIVMPSSAYKVDVSRFEAVIDPVDGWPDTDDRLGAVTIEWVAGNGCPEPIKAAIMILAAHLYENPSGGDVLPPAVTALIAPYRRAII